MVIEGTEKIAVVTLTLAIRCSDEDEVRSLAERLQAGIEAGAEIEVMTSDLSDDEREMIPRIVSWLPPSVMLLPDQLVEGP